MAARALKVWGRDYCWMGRDAGYGWGRLQRKGTNTRRFWIVVMIALFALGIGLVAWEPTGPYSEYCNLDAPVAEPPAGWDWTRDHHNGCAMTLFNDGGDRAPAELYSGTTVEPPPDYQQDWDELGWALAVASFLGFAAILRAPSLLGSRLDVEPNRGKV